MPEWLKNVGATYAFWAVTCAVILALKPFSTWRLAQKSWFGVLIVYLVFFSLGAVLMPLLAFADRFKNEWIRFSFQMLAALLVAVIVLAGIAFFTL